MPDAISPPLHERRSERRRGLSWIAAIVLVTALAWAAWHWFGAADSVTTDNAYVQGNVVVVTPQIAGTVLAVGADDTHRVEAGQVLVMLDAVDAHNLLQQKSVILARTVREIHTLYLQAAALRSTIGIRKNEVERARAELVRTTEGFRRREALQSRGAVSREELQNARAAFDSARSGLASAEAQVSAAREHLAAHLALIEGVPVERHPSIEQAALEVREAWLAVRRTEVRAPLSGHVARRHVQVGQRVAAGANLMSVVPLDQLWVEANFKESQLRDIRIGQAVRLTSDAYGKPVTYTGRVLGLGAGTGAAFSLLPAQNATGNWIKIVQRVPVRIGLDPAQLADHPLRIGLSMHATVDIRMRDGPLPDEAGPRALLAATEVFGELERGADEAVREIIAAHLRTSPVKSSPDVSSGTSGDR